MHFFDINATSVLRVLNACQAANIKGVLQVSSAEIYGDMTGKISENDPIVPHSTYGVSKVAADGLVQVRWREAGVPAIAMRQFNCVGERETHAYVIPEIISQLSKNNTVKLGNNSFRDFRLNVTPLIGLFKRSSKEIIFCTFILFNLFSLLAIDLISVRIKELPSFKISLFNSKVSEKMNNSNTLDKSVNLRTA